jgi:hypothetical protein
MDGADFRGFEAPRIPSFREHQAEDPLLMYQRASRPASQHIQRYVRTVIDKVIMYSLELLTLITATTVEPNSTMQLEVHCEFQGGQWRGLASFALLSADQ